MILRAFGTIIDIRVFVLYNTVWFFDIEKFKGAIYVTGESNRAKQITNGFHC